jgi:hypothetical protein
MFAINPAEAALSRWMRPSVARGWIAQITRYPCDRQNPKLRSAGEAAFRSLLRCDWVTLELDEGDRPTGSQ